MSLSDFFPMVPLTRRLLHDRKFSFRRLHVLCFYYLKLAVSGMIALPVRLFYSRKIRKAPIHPEPLFILGHFRSGTTYLHKLLSADTRFGYVSNYDILCPNLSLVAGNRLGRWLQRFTEFFGIRNYHFNNSIHQLFDPGEEDMFMISKGMESSAYWGFIFPEQAEALRFTDAAGPEQIARWKKEYLSVLHQASYRNSGKPLVLKNPPSTGRIRLLLDLFPNARFVYIHRNAFHLYYSMNNLWTRVIKKYYALEPVNQEQIDRNIFDYYDKLSERYESEKHLIPAGRLLEVDYESLEANPYGTIKRIYAELRLPGFAQMEAALQQRLEAEHRYRKFSYRFEEPVMNKIAESWKSIIHKRGYTRPVTHAG